MVLFFLTVQLRIFGLGGQEVNTGKPYQHSESWQYVNSLHPSATGWAVGSWRFLVHMCFIPSLLKKQCPLGCAHAVCMVECKKKKKKIKLNSLLPTASRNQECSICIACSTPCFRIEVFKAFSYCLLMNSVCPLAVFIIDRSRVMSSCCIQGVLRKAVLDSRTCLPICWCCADQWWPRFLFAAP